MYLFLERSVKKIIGFAGLGVGRAVRSGGRGEGPPPHPATPVPSGLHATSESLLQGPAQPCPPQCHRGGAGGSPVTHAPVSPS